MKLLTLDTASTYASVALQFEETLWHEAVFAPRQQSQLILPMVKAILMKSGIEKVNGLDALAFGAGPGSFTGIRLAASVAQGLGFGANLPIIRCSTLRALAEEALAIYHAQAALVAMDARMGEVYWGFYLKNAMGRMEALVPETLSAPDKVFVPREGQSVPWVGVGNGWLTYNANLMALAHGEKREVYDTLEPLAKHMMPEAVDHFKKSNWVTAEKALPHYLREKVTHSHG